MKFTLKWLKEHLDTNADVETIARTLTMTGLEVEHIEDRAKDLAPFTIGYVVEAVQHPNADKLRVCKVDTGQGVVQVVCGAPNARTGMKGVFAPVGSFIPGTKLDLKKGVIRGVDSNGMLCSMREMGLGQDHDGIIDLAADAPVGQSFAAYMGYDDPVFEIKLTPDRADCLGVHGIARDLAAAGLGTLKPFEPDADQGHLRAAAEMAAHRCRPRLPARGRPLFPQREERPQPAMAAGAADRHRPPPDLGAGRHHQPGDLRPQPPAARVRRRQGDGQSRPCAWRGRARRCWRSTASNMSWSRAWW